MSALHEGWIETTVGEVASGYLSGGTPKSSVSDYWDGAVPWTTSAAIAEDDLYLTGPKRCISDDGLANSSSKVIPKGNLLVGTRVGVGKAVVNLIDIAISQDLTGVLLDTARVNGEFLAYQFKTGRVRSFFEGRKRGATIQGVSRSDLKDVPLSLPPLSEQNSISSILQVVQQSIRSRGSELRFEQERKIALIDYLYSRGSKGESLQKTVLGTVPASWHVKKLDHVAVVQTGVTKGRQISQEEGIEVPYLRVANVQDGYLDLSEVKTIVIRERELDRFSLKEGDVLMTEGGDIDKLGRGFMWEGQIEPCVHQNHVFAVRPDPSVMTPEFLTYYVQSSQAKGYFLSVGHRTTNLASINSTKLKALPTSVPSLREQAEIVEILSVCDEKINALASEIARHEELFQALLEELMTGKLSVAGLLDTNPVSA